MRIYTKAGDLAFKTFTFPDGQPHFKLETYEREFDHVVLETTIKTCADLVLVCLVNSVLRSCGYTSVQLDVRYLLGARMDRAIDWSQPFTLDVVARVINGCGFSRVRLLDVHSEVATRLIRNSESVLPIAAVKQVLATLHGTTDIVIPDKGATDRMNKIMSECKPFGWSHQCFKERDPATGRLSNFVVPTSGLKTADQLLIIDDICDGGGTFVGLAKELKKNGARKVMLFVTHGIFSKGLPLEGIDVIYTTNSYQPDTYGFEKIVCIPVSMKEM